ncbi:MAG: hypothetical protein WC655_06215 [Candidatus Hydrogenedentales bacterium]|jgi:hypothetical protein
MTERTPEARQHLDEAARGVGVSAGEQVEKRLTTLYFPPIRIGILVCGIALPIIALLAELATGVVGSLYIDPIPTVWHILAGILLLASLGVGDVTISRLAYGKPVHRPRLVLFLNAYATTLASVYFIIFAPILPISTLMMIKVHIGGLLGYAPLFCLLSGLYHMWLLRRLMPQETIPRRQARKHTWAGVLVALGLTAAYGGPVLWTQHILRQAISTDAAKRENAVAWIRALHLETSVLEACYEFPDDGLSPYYSTDWPSDMRSFYRLYYRLTGQSHRDAPRPKLPRYGIHAGDVRVDEELVESINDVKGREAAGRERGPRLKGSTIGVYVTTFAADGSGPAVAYVEWTMEIQQTNYWYIEARAHIEMPHGGVPSRLTIWINGEEREAAFGTRGQTRRPHPFEVERQYAPAQFNLVGPDVAMLQCFPIHSADTIKVKVGITAPLVVRGGKSYLRLPYISECNFAIDAKTEHAIWVEIPSGMEGRAASFAQEPGRNGRQGLRAKLTEKALQDPAASTLELSCRSADGQSFLGELNGTRAQAIPRTANARVVPKVCFVLDGSVFMDKAEIDWSRVITALEGKTEVTAVFAGQDVETFSEALAMPDVALAAWFRSRTFEGGCDSAPALEKAWSLLSAQAPEGGAVVWVYGPQDVELSASEELLQLMRRRPSDGQEQIQFFAVQALPGPNRVLNNLTGMVERVPLVGSLTDTLISCIQNGTGDELDVAYSLVSDSSITGQEMNSYAAVHMVRLAVNDVVSKAILSGDDVQKTEAGNLAQTVRIVTPLTGAIVEDSQELHYMTNLYPSADEDAIPGIPEPEEWALLIVVAVVLLAVALKSKAARRAARMAK